jgi:hypothetical protein
MSGVEIIGKNGRTNALLSVVSSSPPTMMFIADTVVVLYMYTTLD